MAYVKTQELKTITLPSDPSYWVKVETNFTYGEIKTIGTDIEGIQASDKYLSLAIKEWNLDDESGKVLEVNQANIDLLKQDDILAVINAINAEAGDNSEKKDSTQ